MQYLCYSSGSLVCLWDKIADMIRKFDMKLRILCFWFFIIKWQDMFKFRWFWYSFNYNLIGFILFFKSMKEAGGLDFLLDFIFRYIWTVEWDCKIESSFTGSQLF